MREVSAWWWAPGGGLTNFGDELTPHIVRALWDIKVNHQPVAHAQFIGAGSILGLVWASGAIPRTLKVWGSGFIEDGPDKNGDRFMFAAVRGHLTAARLGRSDLTVGDPGLLARHLLDDQPEKRYRLGLFPHYVDRSDKRVVKFMDDEDVLLLDAFDPPVQTVRAMAQCEVVLSSSLHGLIVADSLGIPNAHMKLSDNLTGGLYKFLDYYSVFGFDWVPSFDPARIENTSAISAVVDEYERPGLETIIQGIKDAFPYA